VLHEVQTSDIPQASQALADAFRHDPIWNAICEGEPDVGKRLRAIFELPLRHGLRFGAVRAISPNLEGIVAWIPGEHLDMNLWKLIRCRAMGAAMRMGSRVAKRAGAAFGPVTAYRRRHFTGRAFLYLLVLGVASGQQGKGYGGELIGAAIEDSERQRLPLYVGAGSDSNVDMYEHFGFEIVERIELPLLGLPNWEMVRRPSSGRFAAGI